MNRVSRARRDQPYVSDRSGHPCVSLVDDIAVFVKLAAAIKVRAFFDRPLAIIFNRAAVKNLLAVAVHRFKLDPYVERINGPARKEVADLARANYDLHAHRIASA